MHCREPTLSGAPPHSHFNRTTVLREGKSCRSWKTRTFQCPSQTLRGAFAHSCSRLWTWNWLITGVEDLFMETLGRCYSRNVVQKNIRKEVSAPLLFYFKISWNSSVWILFLVLALCNSHQVQREWNVPVGSHELKAEHPTCRSSREILWSYGHCLINSMSLYHLIALLCV